MPNFSELLAYDPSVPTCLVWKVRRRQMQPGDMAGSANGKGYWQIMIDFVRYKAHRIVWELHHGPIPDGFEVDHKDRNKADNTIGNLRLATGRQNRCNKDQISAGNEIGIKGVYPVGSRFRGIVTSDGKRYGQAFATAEEAAQWVRAKRIELHGEFAAH